MSQTVVKTLYSVATILWNSSTSEAVVAISSGCRLLKEGGKVYETGRDMKILC